MTLFNLSFMYQEDTELTKLHRVFRLIELMSRPPRRTVKQYAAQLDVGRRTIERYIKLLERIGYFVENDERHRYFIQVEGGLEDQLDFEEAAYLNDHLQDVSDDNPLRASLLLKVNKQFQLYPVVQTMHRNADFRKLQQLRQAVEDNRVVKIHNYIGGDGKVSTRRVTITDFTEKNDAILAHDLDIDEPRQFRIERMGSVEITAEEAAGNETFNPADIFGWPGTEWFSLRLQLTPRAYQLMTEEYPRSRAMVHRRKDGTIIADLQVRGLTAVARWVRGLPKEIEILPGGVGEELRDLLNEESKVW